MILGIGTKQIEERINQLVGWLRRKIESLGLKIITPEKSGGISGIVSFEVNNPDGLVKTLSAERVFVSVRARRVRVSIHFYNDEDDLRRFINL